jgi:hypothetical protein
VHRRMEGELYSGRQCAEGVVTLNGQSCAIR